MAFLRRLLPGALVLGMLGTARPADAPPLPQPAFVADDFVERIGLSTDGVPIPRLDPKTGASRFPYDPALFYDLGVRHYRLALHYALTPPDQPALVRAAWEKAGVRPMMLIDPRKTTTAEAVVAKLKLYDPGLIDLVEGPNEANNKFPPQELNLRYAGKTDEAAAAAFMDDVYRAMKSDPATRSIPVVAFTAIFTGYGLARPHEGFDFANMHSYQGYDIPSASLVPNEAAAENLLPAGALVHPFVPTECGYNVEADKANGTFLTGSLRAQALNIPMLLAEYFRHGIARTFLFGLPNIDGYGLIESDGVTKRPSYFAVKSLLDALRDAKWDPEKKEWDRPAFEPRALPFTLEGAPASVHSLTLQKRDGSYALLLWNEVRNFDSNAKKDLFPAPVPVTVRFAVPMEREASLSLQGATGERASAPVAIDGQTLRIDVPSTVALVVLRPRDAAGAAPAAPEDLAGTATENSVHLAWTPPRGGEPPAGYFVFRNGEHVATLSGTAFDDASPLLRPGLGYAYAVQAYAKDGALSPRAETVATTPDRRPDLAAVDLLVDPPHPKAGDAVSFRAVFRNAGTGATPNGTGFGVTFHVDGQFVAWHGGFSKVVAPGESVTVAANGGPKGGGTWKATPGVHILRLKLDDQNRIPGEIDKMNNVLERSLDVDVPGDGLIEGRSEASPASVDLSREGSLDWVAWLGDGPVRKSGTAASIGPLVENGSARFPAPADAATRLAWSGGDPAESGTGDKPALWWGKAGTSASFSVPADTAARVLRVYVAGSGGIHGRLTARLSDGSHPDYVSETWDGNLGNGAWCPVPYPFRACYTLRYRAGGPDQKLTVTWTLAEEANRSLGRASIEAATLSAGE